MYYTTNQKSILHFHVNSIELFLPKTHSFLRRIIIKYPILCQCLHYFFPTQTFYQTLKKYSVEKFLILFHAVHFFIFLYDWFLVSKAILRILSKHTITVLSKFIEFHPLHLKYFIIFILLLLH